MTNLITVEGGPERFFRVGRPTADGEVISSSLPRRSVLLGVQRAVARQPRGEDVRVIAGPAS
jgi:hypothetical protein